MKTTTEKPKAEGDNAAWREKDAVEREERAAKAARFTQELEKKQSAKNARAANIKHRHKIIDEAKADIIKSAGIDENAASQVIVAIGYAQIRHVSVNFQYTHPPA